MFNFYTQKYTRIWKVYLNYSKCTWSLDSFFMIESRATRHSAVSAFTETVEFLERSLASMLMRYCCSIIGCLFFLFIFSRHNRLAETHSHLQLSYHITDRLLAAGNHSWKNLWNWPNNLWEIARTNFVEIIRRRNRTKTIRSSIKNGRPYKM